jgi:CRP-like cAMP-binding protein
MVPTNVLKQFELFTSLKEAELAMLAPLCHEKTFDAGADLFVQGRKATRLHLCRSGGVDIIVQLTEPWGINVTVHKAKPGEMFGWSGLVKPHIYTASAKCVEKTDTVYLEASDLVNLFQENPHLGYIMMTNLTAVISSRLTEYRQKLAVEIAATAKKEW